MAEIAMNDIERTAESAPFNPFKDPGGKQSKIHAYCNEPQNRGSSCVWFCRRYGRNVLARDVKIENMEKGTQAFRLQQHFDNWWSRLGFYNIVGVRHVKIKFPQSVRDKHGFRVIVNHVQHADIVANAKASFDDVAIRGDAWECAPDPEGQRHAADYQCANWVKNEYGEGCEVDRRRKALIRLETLEWTPTLLDHYWEHGIEGPGMEFLATANFVWSYSDLALDTFRDAEDPYGKAVDALELVSGWRGRRLLWTTLTAIVLDICIVAIVTLLTGSGETGLAAGSYAAAIEALLIALLTLLSAVV